MSKPTTGRILPDLSNTGLASEEERQRLQGMLGEEPEDPWVAEMAAYHKWLKETPEGRASLKRTQDFLDAEAALAREEEECRSERLLKGLPAYVEPRSLHSKVPDPPWKRKLRP